MSAVVQPYQPVGFAPAWPSRSWTPVPLLVRRIERLVAAYRLDEDALCAQVAGVLGELVDAPDWLPRELLRATPNTYRRELLHEAEDGSFSIGCFVWGPGQQTPIHDHRCWCVMGVAVGAVESVSFYPMQSGALVPGPVDETPAGQCAWIHPEGGDIHRVGAAGQTMAVSLHVYGARFSRVCRNRYLSDGTVWSR
jgi:predicted metal-dependent enzyme (double-stranded beta helix superfamily)